MELPRLSEDDIMKKQFCALSFLFFFSFLADPVAAAKVARTASIKVITQNQYLHIKLAVTQLSQVRPIKISLPAHGRPQTSNHPAIESPFPFLLRSVSLCLPLARLEWSFLILRAVIQY